MSIKPTKRFMGIVLCNGSAPAAHEVFRVIAFNEKGELGTRYTATPGNNPDLARLMKKSAVTFEANESGQAVRTRPMTLTEAKRYSTLIGIAKAQLRARLCVS
mgnify:CR=1 FL=1